MELIEVDREVFTMLTNIAKSQGITRNQVIREFLKLENPLTPTSAKQTKPNGRPQNIQNSLIPHILLILYKKGGRASKKTVEKELFEKYQDLFTSSYFQEKVSNGTPRWKHNIAWAKERAKHLGYIKPPKESGIGIWEITQKGILFLKKNDLI